MLFSRGEPGYSLQRRQWIGPDTLGHDLTERKFLFSIVTSFNMLQRLVECAADKRCDVMLCLCPHTFNPYLYRCVANCNGLTDALVPYPYLSYSP